MMRRNDIVLPLTLFVLVTFAQPVPAQEKGSHTMITRIPAEAQVFALPSHETSRSQMQLTGAAAMQLQRAATRALGDVKRNLVGFGFKSPDEIRDATVGEAILVANVDISKLAAYSDSTEPLSSVLATSSNVLIPIQSGGTVRLTAITRIVPLATRATPSLSYSDRFADDLTQVLHDPALKDEAYHVVQVRELGLAFLVTRPAKGDGERLMPLGRTTRARFRTDKPLDAGAVLLELAKDADRIARLGNHGPGDY